MIGNVVPREKILLKGNYGLFVLSIFVLTRRIQSSPLDLRPGVKGRKGVPLEIPSDKVLVTEHKEVDIVRLFIIVD